MRKTVVPVSLLLFVSLLAIPAQAQYEAVEYTVVVTDTNEPTVPDDWLDVQEIAMGDAFGKLWFRVTLGAGAPMDTNTADDSRFKVELKFTVPAGDEKKITFKPDGGVSAHPEEGEDEEDCVRVKADAQYFCSLPLGASVTQLGAGHELTNIHATTYYMLANQVEGNGVGETTASGTYTIQSGAIKDDAPEVVTETLEDAEAAIEFSATGENKTLIYNWNNTFESLEALYNITVAGGTLTVNVTANGTEILQQEFPASAEGVIPFESAELGAYNITFDLVDFNGTVKLDLRELEEATTGTDGQVDGTTGTTEDADDDPEHDHASHDHGTAANNTTMDEESFLPGFGVFAAVSALGLLAAVARRRD